MKTSDREVANYRHEAGKPCPIAGKVTDHVFSDHERWARYGYPYNACAFCHNDKRTPSQRLTDLNRERGS